MKKGFELPEWIAEQTWADFEQMRKTIRKPLTDAARNLAVKRLIRLYHLGNDPTEVLEQSILNSYQGLWPVAEGRQGRRDSEITRELRVGEGPRVRR